MVSEEKRVEAVAEALVAEDPVAMSLLSADDLAAVAKAAIDAADSADPGMIRVPREPTEAMVEAGWLEDHQSQGTAGPDGLYMAMLAAYEKELG